MTVKELTREQLTELKGSWLTFRNADVGIPTSWDDLANADSIVSDEQIFSEYAGTDFVDDDFLCSMHDPKKEMLKYVGEHIKDWEKEQCWECIGNKCPIPNNISDRINDLCEEWCEDNERPEGFWLNWYSDAEEVFMEL